MFLSHLTLTYFRNYKKLTLDFTRPFTLIQGQNAQGKTNLLEAIYCLATAKPVHAQHEREIVGWQAYDEPLPYANIAAQLHDPQGNLVELEIILSSRGDGINFKKQVRVNGVNKRAMDFIGVMQAVLFLPEDIKLVSGGPNERRHYLDIALCQVDRNYYRALARYQKILPQRNGLLRNLREQGASPYAASTEAQTSFWDEQLIEQGSIVMARRYNFLRQLEGIAKERHRELSSGNEALSFHYIPSFNPGYLSEPDYLRVKEGGFFPQPLVLPEAALDVATITPQFAAKLRSRRDREIAAGNTLYGPHRDDLRFLSNNRDLRAYGSRGQQRTAALSLKLAEVQAMREHTGRTPLLLLDDVMSELDAQRRSTLLAALDGVEQAVVTTTDWGDFTEEFQARAQLLAVRDGVVEVK